MNSISQELDFVGKAIDYLKNLSMRFEEDMVNIVLQLDNFTSVPARESYAGERQTIIRASLDLIDGISKIALILDDTIRQIRTEPSFVIEDIYHHLLGNRVNITSQDSQALYQQAQQIYRDRYYQDTPYRPMFPNRPTEYVSSQPFPQSQQIPSPAQILQSQNSGEPLVTTIPSTDFQSTGQHYPQQVQGTFQQPQQLDLQQYPSQPYTQQQYPSQPYTQQQYPSQTLQPPQGLQANSVDPPPLVSRTNTMSVPDQPVQHDYPTQRSYLSSTDRVY